MIEAACALRGARCFFANCVVLGDFHKKADRFFTGRSLTEQSGRRYNHNQILTGFCRVGSEGWVLKFGTIGSGMIVNRVIEGILDAPGAELEAVYSRSQEKGQDLAARFGAKKVYTDLDAMLADPEIDWVYVASPNSLHFPQTMQALEAGKNVLCEKPFASTAAQAEAMFARAEEKGVLLYEALTTPFLKNYELLREQLARIGRLRLALAVYSQYSSRYDLLRQGTVTNAFDPNFSGGGLMDINYYNVALMVSLFGEPKEAVYWENRASSGVDSSGAALLRYDDFICQCAGGKDVNGDNGVQFQGEDGSVYILGACNALPQIRSVIREYSPSGAPGGWRTEEFPPSPFPNQWREEMRALSAIVAAGDRADCLRRKETTLGTMRTIDRLRLSAGIVFADDSK